MDDEGQHTALVERHRREPQVHCHRRLGSFDESQDAVQETFLRAWRSRVEDGLVIEVTTFRREVFASLGLPARL